jgi:hypothetical protein
VFKQVIVWRKEVEMKKVLFLAIMGGLILCFLGIAVGQTIDTVYIDESVEGANPTVQVMYEGQDVTADRVSNLIAMPEYVSFRLLIDNFGTGDKAYSDLFEDTIGGTLSDRLWIYFDPDAQQNGGLLVTFWSDGADPALLPTDVNFHYPYDAVETGEFQHMGDAFSTNIGSGEYLFYAKSDSTESVPEPSSILLVASGIVGLVGFRKFKK